MKGHTESQGRIAGLGELSMNGFARLTRWWDGRALQGITVTTVVHLCFGYAAVVTGQKPVGYSFLGELGGCKADQISIEAAQPKLDLGVLGELAPKKIMLGVIDLADPAPETSAVVADRIRAALKHVAPERLVPAPDCGMKYCPAILPSRN